MKISNKNKKPKIKINKKLINYCQRYNGAKNL